MVEQTLTQVNTSSNGTLDGENQTTKQQVNNDSSEIGKATPIPGVPFASVKMDENHYEIVVGNQIMTNHHFLSHEDAENWCSETDWLPFLNLIQALIDINKKMDKINLNS